MVNRWIRSGEEAAGGRERRNPFVRDRENRVAHATGNERLHAVAGFMSKYRNF